MKALLVRVGVDQAYGQWNAPVDPFTNRFFYLPIPENAGTAFTPDLERKYLEFLSPFDEFCKACRLHDGKVRFPVQLLDQSVHLDPDFDELTYGDNGPRRGSAIKTMASSDLLVFYAGLRPTSACEHRLIYALIGLYVVDEVIAVQNVPAARWHQNAHTRKQIHCPTDIIVRARRGASGRFDRCIPIGGWRDGAYRVRRDVLEEWGGLSVKDGYIQRSAVPPSFTNPQRFYNWVTAQNIPLIERNN